MQTFALGRHCFVSAVSILFFTFLYKASQRKQKSQVNMACPWLQNHGNPLGLFCFVAMWSTSHFQVNLKKQSGKWRGCPRKRLEDGSCCAVCKEQASEALFLLVHFTNFKIGFLSSYVMLGDNRETTQPNNWWERTEMLSEKCWHICTVPNLANAELNLSDCMKSLNRFCVYDGRMW